MDSLGKWKCILCGKTWDASQIVDGNDIGLNLCGDYFCEGQVVRVNPKWVGWRGNDSWGVWSLAHIQDPKTYETLCGKSVPASFVQAPDALTRCSECQKVYDGQNALYQIQHELANGEIEMAESKVQDLIADLEKPMPVVDTRHLANGVDFLYPQSGEQG